MSIDTEIGDDAFDKDEATSGRDHPTSRPPGAPERDLWDYIGILSRPMAALLTAIAVGAIGWFGNQAVVDREDAVTARTQIEQNYRLYTELMSRREQAESALRKDMFTEILSNFFIEADSTDPAGSMSKRILKLEMLALNFSDSLSLSPLFREIDRDIRASAMAGDSPTDSLSDQQEEFQSRLHSLAKKVSDSQVSTLSLGGSVVDIEIQLARVIGNGTQPWPDAWINLSEDLRISEIQQTFNALKQTYPAMPDGDLISIARVEAERQTRFEDGWYQIDFGDLTRQYQLTFSEANEAEKTVRVQIEIREVFEPGTPREGPPDDRQVAFELSYFDFPLIDNIRLSGDQRFALVLEDFDDRIIRLSGILFPGMYASQRDKPFFDDVIENMRKRTENELRSQESEQQDDAGQTASERT